MIGGVIITTFRYEYVLNPDTSTNYDATISDMPSQAILYLGSVQAVTSFMLVVGFMVNSASLIVKAGWRQRVAQCPHPCLAGNLWATDGADRVARW